MCHFITLIAREADESRVAAALAKHGRSPRRVENPAIARLLAEGERQYITARSCDCGTALGMVREAEERVAGELARQRNRLSRLGWSEAKMERWTRDRIAADARRADRRVDSIDYWDRLLGELGQAGVKHIGLVLHSYAGALDQPFDCSVDPTIHGADRRDVLGSLEEDVVTRFATDMGNATRPTEEAGSC